MGMWLLLAMLFISYLIAVRSRRFHRLRRMHALYSERLHDLTPRMAQKICQECLLYETPTTMLLGTQVALFKVYGISSIASTLSSTGQLKSPRSLTKRLADTAILISTWVSNPLHGPGSGESAQDIKISKPCDPRCALAVARVNYLHGKYHIKNDDYRYNLALFILEPIRWTKRCGWRSHTLLERHAFFVFWIEIGRRMGIKDTWETFGDMEEWVASYEAKYMIPSDSSEELANLLFKEFLGRIPNIPGLRRLFRGVILCILDDRTRYAMRLPDPPLLTLRVVHSIFATWAFVVRHLCLPRSSPSLWVPLDDPPTSAKIGNKNTDLPRMHAVFKRRPPWYYLEATGWRKVVQGVLVRLGILNPDKLPGKNWKSQGYRLEELGPEQFEREGHDEVMKVASELQGRPVTGPWARPSR